MTDKEFLDKIELGLIPSLLQQIEESGVTADEATFIAETLSKRIQQCNEEKLRHEPFTVY